MSTKFKNLRNDLKDLEDGGQLDIDSNQTTITPGGSSKLANYILLFAFIATLTFYAGSKFNISEFNPINNIVQEFTQPSEDLLQGMGVWMEDMGYGMLSREELIDLRSAGVTATYTSQIREIGYTDITLEQLVDLKRVDISATYARMMKELGYDLTPEDLVTLRNNSVTAFFTSNMLDLGYTLEELSKENLIRLRSVGVTQADAENLLRTKGEKPSVEELIRYRISNQ